MYQCPERTCLHTSCTSAAAACSHLFREVGGLSAIKGCLFLHSGALSFRRLRELDFDFEYPGLTEALQFAQQQADALLTTLGLPLGHPVKTKKSGLKLAGGDPTAGHKPDKVIRLLAAQ